jgi:hypothetical protein
MRRPAALFPIVLALERRSSRLGPARKHKTLHEKRTDRHLVTDGFEVVGYDITE